MDKFKPYILLFTIVSLFTGIFIFSGELPSQLELESCIKEEISEMMKNPRQTEFYNLNIKKNYINDDYDQYAEVEFGSTNSYGAIVESTYYCKIYAEGCGNIVCNEA